MTRDELERLKTELREEHGEAAWEAAKHLRSFAEIVGPPSKDPVRDYMARRKARDRYYGAKARLTKEEKAQVISQYGSEGEWLQSEDEFDWGPDGCTLQYDEHGFPKRRK